MENEKHMVMKKELTNNTKNEWRLLVSYPFDETFVDKQNKIEKLVGIEVGASGAGMGHRDLEFFFSSQEVCDRAMCKIVNACLDFEVFIDIDKIS